MTYATNISEEVEKFSSQLGTFLVFQVSAYVTSSLGTLELHSLHQECCRASALRSLSGAAELWSSTWGALPSHALLHYEPRDLCSKLFVWSLSKIFSSESLPRPTSCRRQETLKMLFSTQYSGLFHTKPCSLLFPLVLHS